MNKRTLMVLVVIVLLLLGGWFFMSKKSQSSSTSQTTNGTQQNQTASSLKDLISKGIAQTCTFNGDNSQGTIYVSGTKVRGDFDATVNNQVTKSHMIVTDNTSYIWMDGQKTGFKMSFDPNATPATGSGSATSTSGAFDASANMNYKCSSWLVDASMFTLPTGVTFSSFSVPSASGNSGTSQCSYCTPLTGDDKVQCLKAFNCQ